MPRNAESNPASSSLNSRSANDGFLNIAMAASGPSCLTACRRDDLVKVVHAFLHIIERFFLFDPVFRLQPSFVRMLRREWENDTLPFYFVQLAQYKTILPELKWIQAQTLDLIPYSGMASAHDVGEYSCIHPADKETVGDRLAFLALTKDYGFGHVDADTPVPVKFEFLEGQACKVLC